MSKISNKKYKYSKIQYFFWLLSGAEISILKDCPTDYNRQTGIGFTIFMTTLLAFFSGSYAGYYFGESYLSAVIFGIIWASLIFSIDRSMVVTLKKDPTKEKQNFWAAFLSRGVLAILIAFIISIPLELLIFKENIDLHMDKYKLDQVYSVQQASKRNEAISDKQRVLSSDSLVLDKVETQLSHGEPKGDPEYDRLKSEIHTTQKEYDALGIKLNTARIEVNKAYKNVPTYYDYVSKANRKNRNSQQWQVYENKLVQRREAQDNLNKFDTKGLNDLKKRRKEYIDTWISNLKGEQKRLNDNIVQTSTSINKGFATAETAKNEFQDKIKDKKGFVLRFMVLENLAKRNNPEIPEGATIFMLLWLIRILFFTIEILPTIAKIATPIGAYDNAIYRKEKDIELDLYERTSEYIKQQKILRDIEYEAEQEQTRLRTQIENKLHKELLTEIAIAQNKIAREKIEEFKSRNSTQTKIIV